LNQPEFLTRSKNLEPSEEEESKCKMQNAKVKTKGRIARQEQDFASARSATFAPLRLKVPGAVKGMPGRDVNFSPPARLE
jgi:hypothetical protein